MTEKNHIMKLRVITDEDCHMIIENDYYNGITYIKGFTKRWRFTCFSPATISWMCGHAQWSLELLTSVLHLGVCLLTQPENSRNKLV